MTAKQLVNWGDRMISNTDREYADFAIDREDTEEYRLLPFRSPAALEVFDHAATSADSSTRFPSEARGPEPHRH